MYVQHAVKRIALLITIVSSVIVALLMMRQTSAAVSSRAVQAELTVDHTGPTRFGEATVFTISIGASSNVTYVIDFGDGNGAYLKLLPSPYITQHVYTRTGFFDVAVQATDGISIFAQGTVVEVQEAVGDIAIDEGFEGPISINWDLFRLEPLGVGGWAVTDTEKHSGNSSVFHDDNFVGQDGNVLNEMDSWLVSRRFLLSAESMLHFYSMLRYDTTNGQHSVYISTGSTVPKDDEFQLIKRLPISPSGRWVSDTIDLSQFAGQEAVIAFRYEGTFADEWYLDDIMLEGGFTAINDSPTELGQPTVFSATLAEGTDLTFTWDFDNGDKIITTVEVIEYTFPVIGTYSVTLMAENSVSSATATTEAEIAVAIAGLSVTNTSPNDPNVPTTFNTTTSAGSDIIYYWEFGDGQVLTTTDLNPMHTYTQTGHYTATVTASNSLNSSSVSTVVIVETGVLGMQLHAPAATPLGDATVFSVTVTSGTNVEYTYSLGDGTVKCGVWRIPSDPQYALNDLLRASAIASQFQLNHTYADVGDYTVVFTTSNRLGFQTRQAVVSVDVEPGSPWLYEDFEPDGIPHNWNVYTGRLDGTGWQTTTERAHSPMQSAFHDDSPGEQDSWLVTSQVTPSLGSELVFWEYIKYTAFPAMRTIHISTGSGDPKDLEFVELARLERGGESEWAQLRFSLADYVGQPLYIGFHYAGNFSDEWYLDDIMVTAPFVAVNDSTTIRPNTTHFTSTAPLGTRLAYEWDFGDGAGAATSNTSYRYPHAGFYTAVVTASNSTGQITATTRVTIVEHIYLPITLKDFIGAPDLIVASILVTGSEVAVWIQNNGTSAVTDPFWVDLLVDPSPAPSAVNDTLEALGATGFVWGVPADVFPLKPGQSLILTRNGPYFDTDRSNFYGAFVSGSTLYAQVDSANTLDEVGGVLELHEIRNEAYNNITQFVVP